MAILLTELCSETSKPLNGPLGVTQLVLWFFFKLSEMPFLTFHNYDTLSIAICFWHNHNKIWSLKRILLKSKYYLFLKSGRKPKLGCCSVKPYHKKSSGFTEGLTWTTEMGWTQNAYGIGIIKTHSLIAYNVRVCVEGDTRGTFKDFTVSQGRKQFSSYL